MKGKARGRQQCYMVPFMMMLLSMVSGRMTGSLSLQAGCLPDSRGLEALDPPVNGMVEIQRDVLLTFSDGYRALMDVYSPTVKPGPQGWPTILFIHQNRGSKESMEENARYYAAIGFVALAFDVRGQGSSMSLNDPEVYGRGPFGLRERMDVFEVFEQAEQRFPALIDFRRLGVTGPTQGGFFGWSSAAHSGKLPPPNPWRTRRFPSIAAVAVHDFDIDIGEWLVPGGTNVSDQFLWNITDASGLHVNPRFKATAEALLLEEDFPALRRLVDPPGSCLPKLLEDSQVPLFVTASYDDKFGGASRTLEAWPSLVPGADKFLNLINSGHGSPENDREIALRQYRERIWFNYQLRGVDEGIKSLSPYRFAVIPSEAEEYLEPSTLWDEYQSSVPPQIEGQTSRYFLSAGGSLVSDPSLVRPGSSSLVNRNLSGLGIEDLLQDPAWKPEDILGQIPLAGPQFDGPTLTEDALLVGSPRVSLDVSSVAADFLIAGVLCDISPTGEQRIITSGATTIRGHASGRASVTFLLAAYAYRMQPGHHFRLLIQNHHWHRPPMKRKANGSTPSYMRSLPVFTESTVTIAYSPAGLSMLELPLQSGDPVRLVAAQPELLDWPQEGLQLGAFTSSSCAGERFLILPGLQGSAPGVNLAGQHVPLNLDPLARSVLAGATYGRLRGKLDPDGQAQADFCMPMPLPCPVEDAKLTLVLIILKGDGSLLHSLPLRLPIRTG